MDHKTIFSYNLRKLMEINMKSRNDICEALGYSYYTITDWVNGKKMPRMDKVQALADYFGVQISDLVEEDKKIPTKEEGFLDGDTERMRSLIKRIRTCSPEELDRMEQILRIVQGE